jgi:hypothetical protein
MPHQSSSMRFLHRQKMNGTNWNAQAVSSKHKPIIDHKLVPCTSLITIQQDIFKIKVKRILFFN